VYLIDLFKFYNQKGKINIIFAPGSTVQTVFPRIIIPLIKYKKFGKGSFFVAHQFVTMKKKLLLSSFLCLACSTHFKSWSQDILWEKSYGGKHADYLFDAQPTSDNGFILAGSSLSGKTGGKTDANKGDLDYWIWKMDEKGGLDWQKSFGGSGPDLLQSVKITSDGGFILAGVSKSGNELDKKAACIGNEDFWIIKLNAMGDEQWQRTIGGEGQEQLQSIVQTKDGGFILGGSSASDKIKEDSPIAGVLFGKSENSYGNLDYWIVKLDNKGKIEWQKTYGGTYSDILRSIEQAKDGGYILGGYSNSPESGNKTEQNLGKGDYWVIKIDKDGVIEWQKVFGGVGDDQLQIVHQSYDGNYIAGGSSSSDAGGNKSKSNVKGIDLWIVKLEEKGDVIWEETYDIGKTDILTSIVENDDHTLLIGGYAKSETIGTKKRDKEGVNDYIAIKVKETGEELWTKSVGSAGEDILRKVTETRDGGYLMVGTSNGKASNDKNSNVGRNDFWAVKLKDRQKPPKKAVLVEAIPNPASQYTNVIIGYDFEKGMATVIDISGRILQQFEIYDRTVPIDLSGKPEGIYIVQIKTNVSTDSVKILKQGN
jgi:hypothetical protein